MDSDVDYEKLIHFAVLQYKFALGIRSSLEVVGMNIPLSYPESWAWGNHVFTREDLALDDKDKKEAAMLLVHSTLLTIGDSVSCEKGVRVCQVGGLGTRSVFQSPLAHGA